MKKAVLTIFFAVILGIGIYCGYRYYSEGILPEKRLEAAENEQLRLFDSIRPDTVSEETATAEVNYLEKAEKVNSGVVGWLNIPGTNVDYPIAQGQDNDFYLHNGFNGEYNYELGCPFLDYRCEGDFTGFNSIVYAHNMEGRAMFADIALYKDEDFMASHPQGVLTTAEGVYAVQFFAYLSIPSNAPAYHAVFLTDRERQEYIDYLFDAAKYTVLSAGDISTDMQLLLLSTCTFESDDSRGVLVGIKLPPKLPSA